MSICDHAPLMTESVPFGLTVIGGPTTVVDLGGHRLICDPADVLVSSGRCRRGHRRLDGSIGMPSGAVRAQRGLSGAAA